MMVFYPPVCTLSPTCSWDIVMEFPFARNTSATPGKQGVVSQSQQCGLPKGLAPNLVWHTHWPFRLHMVANVSSI